MDIGNWRKALNRRSDTKRGQRNARRRGSHGRTGQAPACRFEALEARLLLSADLFFSEYVEGSSYNKALEIYNPTAAPADLSDYRVLAYHNGNASPSYTINLSGTIAPGDVFVLCNNQPSVDPAITAVADLVTGSINFNGDDSLTLEKNTGSWTVIDSLGQVGYDPGSYWGTGSVTTQNHTLRRKATITLGDPNAGDVFDPTTEWDGYAQDTFGGLGSHSAAGVDFAPAVASTTPADSDMLVAVDADITIDFSEPVNASGSSFAIVGLSSGSHSAAVTGGPTSFTLNPAADFAHGETVTVTVFSAHVTDADTDDPPDHMAGDHVFTFTVVPDNLSPVVDDIPNQVRPLGDAFATIHLDDYVDDPDDLDEDIIWTYSGDSNLSVSIDTNCVATVAPISGTWTGSETITFTATDLGGLYASDSATFAVYSGSPSTVAVGVAEDAQVVEGNPTSNYGDKTYAYVQSDGAGTYLNERVWMSFNLADQLPAGAVITSATLRMFCWKTGGPDDLVAEVRAGASDGWDEMAITWANQPSYGDALDTATLITGADAAWYDWDVTSFVQGEHGGDDMVSMVVKAQTEGTATATSFGFDAKEYSPTLAPELLIEYVGDWSAEGGFTIYHVNDVHGRVTPHEVDVPGVADVPEFEQVGGAAYLAATLMELKAANPESLFLDAGDMSEGNPLGDLRGNGGILDVYSTIDAQLKTLGGRGIDALVVGNHDVRDLTYIQNIQNSALPFISVNVCHEGTQNAYFAPYVTVAVNGLKVGVLGYTNDESSYLGGSNENLLDIVECAWEDHDASTIDLKDWVETLRTTEGCDVVILLSHMGHARTIYETRGGLALLADIGGVKVPEVAITGHWHTYTDTAWQPGSLNGKTIFQESASYMQYLGELRVTEHGRYVSAIQHAILTDEITPNAAVEAAVAALEAEYAAGSPAHGLYDVVGYSAVDLRMDKDKWWAMDEYPWNGDNTAGEWVADSMVWKAQQAGYGTTVLAVQSGGGIRRSVPAGELTYVEVYEVYPWSDDYMYIVDMTGQEIWDVIEDEHCGASISAGWEVYADDGIISAIRYLGSPIDLDATYRVAISEYMYLHHDGYNQDGERVHGWPGDLVAATTESIREGVVDYSSQFSEANPMTVDGPRYFLDTEMAGVFDAVVTFAADTESRPVFEAAFVRLLSASADTVERRGETNNYSPGQYVMEDLVNADGSINYDHQLSEGYLYRSHLDLADGELQNGDIIRIKIEGGFYAGNPQLTDQQGIVSDGVQFELVGHDPSLAAPNFMPDIASFWDNWHENHYVEFYATKTGDHTVSDANGHTIAIYQKGAYYEKSLPGNVGDTLVLTGAQTYRYTERRFRCDSVEVSTITGTPPSSAVDAIAPGVQTGPSINLTAQASDLEGLATLSLTPTDDAFVLSGSPDANRGSWSAMYLTKNSGTYGEERIFTRFDLSSIPAGAAITSARLKLYSFGSGTHTFDAACSPVAGDAWDESTITWNSQPAYGAALDTIMLGDTDSWYSWDVTSFMQAEAAGDQTASLAVTALDGTAYHGFNAKEYGSTAPQLEISYEESGPATSVEDVTFHYRYSADSRTWGGWAAAGTDDTGPTWEQTFTWPDGEGYYEFYSVATDNDANVESAPVFADAACQYRIGANDAPDAPSSPTPGDYATDVSNSPKLTVVVTDPNADLMDVSFYDAADDSLIGTFKGVAEGGTASALWYGLADHVTYQWYAVADDGIAQTTSPTWTFWTPSMPGDANGDGRVDATDYIAFKRHYGLGSGATRADGDFDGDSDVDWYDLQELAANMGASVGVSSQASVGDSSKQADPVQATSPETVEPTTSIVAMATEAGSPESAQPIITVGKVGNESDVHAITINLAEMAASKGQSRGRIGMVVSQPVASAGLDGSLSLLAVSPARAMNDRGILPRLPDQAVLSVRREPVLSVLASVVPQDAREVPAPDLLYDDILDVLSIAPQLEPDMTAF